MEKKRARKKRTKPTTASMEATFTHRLLRRPDFFFFLFFGRGDGELLDFLFSLNKREKEKRESKTEKYILIYK